MKLLNPKLILFLFVTFNILMPSLSFAKEEYADRTGQSCEVCHISAEGGGALTATGEAYKAGGYRWPPEKGLKPILPLPKIIKVLVGYLHILTAFAWFGTILYVHLILKPAYASEGLPKGEVLLGFSSMLIIAISGIVLTLSRVNALSTLGTTLWGILLLVKIGLFLIMVSTAIFAVLVIGPRLKKKKSKKNMDMPKDGVFNPLTLSGFDGKDGKQTFVAYNGKVYDLSGSKLWATGTHYKRHFAGMDMTGALAKAPHNAEKLDNFKMVGVYDPVLHAIPDPDAKIKKIFYFIAYMNLVLVFAIIFVLALWEWAA